MVHNVCHWLMQASGMQYGNLFGWTHSYALLPHNCFQLLMTQGSWASNYATQQKSGYHQGKLPNRLQNVVKTHIAFYLNTINTLPTFYPTVNKPKLFTIFSKTAQVVEAHTMCPTFSASNGRWPYGCCRSCKKAKFFLKGFSNVDLIKMST